MNIKKRSNLNDKFSTFLTVEERDGFVATRWVPEPKLRRNMERMVNLKPKADEVFWELYWLKEAVKAPPNSQARWHLLAYLEESCYWTTYKICQNLTNRGVNLVEVLAIAKLVIVDNLENLFAKYDSHISRFKTYAQLKLKDYILEELRRREKIEKTRSDWGLLRSLNPTSVQRALQDYGFPKSRQTLYQLAWSCFKAIYVPTPSPNSRKLLPPTNQQLEAMVCRYNQQRSRHQLKTAIDVQELQNLLETCINAVRSQFQRTPNKAVSLDAFDSSSFVPEPGVYDPTIEKENREAEWNQVSTILSDKFNGLSEETRKMMTLWLGLGFGQTEIANCFGLRQDKFSRNMKREGKTLLTELLQTLGDSSQNQEKIELSSSQIDKKAQQVYFWVSSYCQAPYHEFLKTTLLKQLDNDRELLQRHYGEGLSLEKLASNLKISQSEIKARITKAKQALRPALKSYVETNLRISLSSFSRADEWLSVFVEDWLRNAPYAAF